MFYTEDGREGGGRKRREAKPSSIPVRLLSASVRSCEPSQCPQRAWSSLPLPSPASLILHAHPSVTLTMCRNTTSPTCLGPCHMP